MSTLQSSAFTVAAAGCICAPNEIPGWGTQIRVEYTMGLENTASVGDDGATAEGSRDRVHAAALSFALCLSRFVHSCESNSSKM